MSSDKFGAGYASGGSRRGGSWTKRHRGDDLAPTAPPPPTRVELHTGNVIDTATEQIIAHVATAPTDAAAIEDGKLLVALIRQDGGTQSRAQINAETVHDYADALDAGIALPAVVVYHDGEHYWLADGFHRVNAAKLRKHERIAAEVRQGTRREAILHSVGANADHGLRRTNGDKRRAVTTLLKDDEWAAWSDRQIARRAHVSHNFVSEMRRICHPMTDDGTRTVQRNGTTYTMTIPQDENPYQIGDTVLYLGRPTVVRSLMNGIVGVLREDGGVSLVHHKLLVAAPEIVTKNVTTITGHEDGATDAEDTTEVQPPKTFVQSFAPDAFEIVPEAYRKTRDEIAKFRTESNEWYTPASVIDAARVVLGSIDLDPASCEYANATVQAARIFTKAEDGLAQEWTGKVWMNPPYGVIGNEAIAGRWVEKAIAEYRAGRVTRLLMIVNAVTDRLWFQPLFDFPICFTRRIKFERSDDSMPEAPLFGSAVAYLGDAEGAALFAQTFKPFGAVMRPFG